MSAHADVPPDLAPLDGSLLARWPLPLDDHDDKHARGTVLVVGGSPQTAGAVVLAGIAALRMGAGRVQLAVAEAAALAVTVAVPEALVVCLPVRPDGSLRARRATAVVTDLAERADAVLIGPGLMSDASTGTLLRMLIPIASSRAVVVLDAAAATNTAGIADVVRPARGRLAVVANRHEIHVLLRNSDVDVGGAVARQVDDGEGEGANRTASLRATADLRRVAEALGATATSFGTVVHPDGRGWHCSWGTAGLGTSGSGDVLGGLVAGAAARCGDATQAAIWATYAHARAGAALSEEVGPVGFLARDIAAHVPRTMRDISSTETTSDVAG